MANATVLVDGRNIHHCDTPLARGSTRVLVRVVPQVLHRRLTLVRAIAAYSSPSELQRQKHQQKHKNPASHSGEFSS